MFDLPSVPTWDGFHPLVVHFPIVLLIVAPLLILIGMLKPKFGKCLFIAGFILMALGTISTYFAVATGEEAGELAMRTEQINQVIGIHENLAETTRIYFSIMTIVYLAYLFYEKIFKKEFKHKVHVLINIAFLIIYSIGLLILANTAHNGGRLVHELGVRAIM